MKVLLDENLPHQLRTLLTGHNCFTVTFMGWNGVKNGDLLQRAATEGFDVLVSGDQGLAYEQGLASLPIAVIVLITRDNKLATISSLGPRILAALTSLTPKSLVKIEAKA